MDIDSMTPDELRRRLREALAEIEELKARFRFVRQAPAPKEERPDL